MCIRDRYVDGRRDWQTVGASFCCAEAAPPSQPYPTPLRYALGPRASLCSRACPPASPELYLSAPTARAYGLKPSCAQVAES
eukprot:3604980-Alexandrium_andersonii.AAC.1